MLDSKLLRRFYTAWTHRRPLGGALQGSLRLRDSYSEDRLMVVRGARLLATVWAIAIPTACLARPYLPPNIELEQVTDKSSIEEIMSQFDRSLRLIGSDARIVGCDQVYNFVDTSVEARQHSYGAICHLKTKSRITDVLMCDDWLVGEFTMTTSFSETREAVGEFIGKNCPQ